MVLYRVEPSILFTIDIDISVDAQSRAFCELVFLNITCSAGSNI
eukprot:COSAG02_NODE_4741_length_5035_cov_2.309562_8_plen_43_part_01